MIDGDEKSKQKREKVAVLFFDGLHDLIAKLEAEYGVVIRLLENNLVAIDDDYIYDEWF